MDIVYGGLVGFLSSLVAVVVVEWRRRPHLTFRPDVTDPDLQGWRFVSVEVENRRRRVFHLFDQTAHLCTAHVEFRDRYTDQNLIEPISARWPTLKAQPFDAATGHLDIHAILIPHRETIPPGGKASINVAVKFHRETECYGFNNRSYLYQPPSHALFRAPDQRLDHTKMHVRVVVTCEGVPTPSPYFMLRNPDSSMYNFTLTPPWGPPYGP